MQKTRSERRWLVIAAILVVGIAVVGSKTISRDRSRPDQLTATRFNLAVLEG